MNPTTRKYTRFGLAIAIIVVSLGYLAYTGVQESKSYYVTIKELRKEGDGAFSKRLRVAGNVQPGSIHLSGTSAEFVIVEKEENQPEQVLRVSYKGTEPPPDTFKDNAQALVLGEYGRDGVFHAHEIQAKCASKYAPQQQQQQQQMAPAQTSKGY
jgi:cytochrome c-type biogenesis protein CcmE